MKKSVCGKCGLELGWKQITVKGEVKWCPTNPDGSDHWDICRLTQFKNSGQRVKVGELTWKTVAKGKPPKYPDDGLPPWDESIIEDWSWCRGSKVVASKEAYKSYKSADEMLKMFE